MPGVIGYGKRVAAIRREWHLGFLRFSTAEKHLVEDGADMWRRVVGRQVKLHRDSLPETVSVFENAISRNVSSQDWHRIHLHVLKGCSEPAFQARREPLHESRLHFFRAKDAARHIPDSTLPWWQVPSVFGKKIDLGASGFSIGSAAAHFAFARHCPVILRDRHGFQHLPVKIVGKHTLES